MIFVTIGSTDFDPLVAKMDELAPRLGEDVLMQIGLGKHVPKNGQFFRFAQSLDDCYARADVVVAHGGLGTIVEVLERGKKLVCVVNPATYDRHQEHLLGLFSTQNTLIWCKDLEQLEEAIQQAKTTRLSPYLPPECHIHERILEYLGKQPRQ
jgi:beta-1,4-N-acetylglucosaminyltransferase